MEKDRVVDAKTCQALYIYSNHPQLGEGDGIPAALEREVNNLSRLKNWCFRAGQSCLHLRRVHLNLDSQIPESPIGKI